MPAKVERAADNVYPTSRQPYFRRMRLVAQAASGAGVSLTTQPPRLPDLVPVPSARIGGWPVAGIVRRFVSLLAMTLLGSVARTRTATYRSRRRVRRCIRPLWRTRAPPLRSHARMRRGPGPETQSDQGAARSTNLPFRLCTAVQLARIGAMLDWIPSWATTALIAMATTIFTGRYISPLLEVRNRRFQMKMQAQEKLTSSALAVLSAVMKLRTVQVPDGVTETLRSALTEERARWRQQLDEATRHLADHSQEFVFTFRGPGAILGMRYCATARMVWISDRTDEDKLRHLLEITTPFHMIFLGSRLRLLSLGRAIRELERLLEALDEEGRPPLPEGRPAPAVEA